MAGQDRPVRKVITERLHTDCHIGFFYLALLAALPPRATANNRRRVGNSAVSWANWPSPRYRVWSGGTISLLSLKGFAAPVARKFRFPADDSPIQERSFPQRQVPGMVTFQC